MDEIVLQAMAKWPNVPAVYGWLALDRRGNWLLKGEPITNEALNAFIDRNYLPDDAGCWYFQNGPQRVFVALAYTPFVYRVASNEHQPLGMETHTGLHASVITAAMLDENGMLVINADPGPGMIYDLDLERLAPYFVDAHGLPLDDDALEAWSENAPGAPRVRLRFAGKQTEITRIRSSDVPRRFGFVSAPVPPEAVREA